MKKNPSKYLITEVDQFSIARKVLSNVFINYVCAILLFLIQMFHHCEYAVPFETIPIQRIIDLQISSSFHPFSFSFMFKKTYEIFIWLCLSLLL